jgi:hypothetical protein
MTPYGENHPPRRVASQLVPKWSRKPAGDSRACVFASRAAQCHAQVPRLEAIAHDTAPGG